eukprot:68107_1
MFGGFMGAKTVTVEDTQNRNLTRKKQGHVIEWKITSNLLQQVKNATKGQEFLSPEFETIDGTKWRIMLQPLKNGFFNSPGCSLKCVTLSANKAKIGVNALLKIMELDKSGIGGHTFTEPGRIVCLNTTDALPKQIQSLSTLTIQCIVEKTMDVSTSDTLFEWKITKPFLQQWKNAKKGERFRSPQFNAVGYKWYLYIYPNGKDTEGTAHLYIDCYGLKKDDSKGVSYYADTIGLVSNVHQVKFNKRIYKNEDKCVDKIVCDPPFQMNDIRNQFEINIAIKLWRSSIIFGNVRMPFATADDMGGKVQSIIDRYSKQNQKIPPKAWREFFVASPTQITNWLVDLGFLQFAAIFKENQYETISELHGLSNEDLEEMGIEEPELRKTIIDGIKPFLLHLGLEQYLALFQENECKTMDNLKKVTKSDLNEMGIKALGHRVKIIEGIAAHFTSKPRPRRVPNQEESKLNDNANARNNPLMICIGIEQYYEALANLKTAKDIETYKSVFEDLYNYKIFANDPSKPMNAKELLKFLRKARKYLYDYEEDEANHDSLIVTFGGHGTHDSVICSDGSKVTHKKIRDAFKLEELNGIPKIFIFDSCRSDDDPEEEEQKQKHRGVAEARGFSVTLMTSEGAKVYGAKICKHITQEFKRMYEDNQFKTLYTVCRTARNKIKNETKMKQDLIFGEHDLDTDDLVFGPRDEARGGPQKRYDADIRQGGIANPLRKFLKDIRMDRYYEDFKEKGFGNTALLRELDDTTLELMVKVPRHREIILKAVKKL